MGNQHNTLKQRGFHRLCLHVAITGWWQFTKDRIWWEFAVTLFLLIAKASLQSPESISDFLTNIMAVGLQDNLVLILPIGGFLLLLFLYQYLFVAPKNLYKIEQSRADEFQSELASFKDEESKNKFDWSAKETAEYIMQQYDITLDKANDFVEDRSAQREIDIEAKKELDSAPVAIDKETLKSCSVYLIPTSHNRIENEAFGFPFHEEGWLRIKKIASKYLRPDFYRDTYFAPRFKSHQIKTIIKRSKG